LSNSDVFKTNADIENDYYRITYIVDDKLYS